MQAPVVIGSYLIRAASLVAVAAVLASAAVPALGQEQTAAGPPGLPPGVDWTFNLDVTLGAFGFADSLYTDPKPEQPSGNLGDNWQEGTFKPALSGTYTSDSSAQWYGKLSGVGERTFGAAPSLVGEDASSSNLEDLYFGWRSGMSIGGEENVLDFTVGRAPYTLGHGLLLWDGSAEGGTRGGYWTNARKAFELAAIGRFDTGSNKLEAFWLDKDDLPEADSETKLWGVNYEYAIGENSTLGASYMKFSANPAEAPQRDGLDVYNLRAFIAAGDSLSFEAEYAVEDNGAVLDSTAWNALVGYQVQRGWMPKFSYRYAIFEGDDPGTVDNEAFDGLLTGFYDWGTWWQGEIGGEYFISNSNLISHQLRVHSTPRDGIGMGLIYFDFRLDVPGSYAPGVTSDDLAQEIDWYMDWSVNDHFTVSFVFALADPGEAVSQTSGRTDTFVYGMAYVAYKY